MRLEHAPGRLTVAAIAVLFILVVAMTVLFRPGGDAGTAAQSPPNFSMPLPNVTGEMPEINYSLDPQDSSPAPPNASQYYGDYNCTPLGSAQEILPLNTYYLVIYDGNTIYTKYTFDGVFGTTAVYSVDTRGSFQGIDLSSTARYTYGLDGQCISAEYTPMFSGDSGRKVECSGYPVWVACSQMVSGDGFVRNETVELRGVKHSVGVYKQGSMEVWIGNSLPIIYKYSLVDESNKSVYMELLDVGYV